VLGDALVLGLLHGAELHFHALLATLAIPLLRTLPLPNYLLPDRIQPLLDQLVTFAVLRTQGIKLNVEFRKAETKGESRIVGLLFPAIFVRRNNP